MSVREARDHLLCALGVMAFDEKPESKRGEQLHDAIVIDIKSALTRLEKYDIEA